MGAKVILPSSILTNLKSALKYAQKNHKDIGMVSNAAIELRNLLYEEKDKKKEKLILRVAKAVSDEAVALADERTAQHQRIKKFIKEVENLEKNLARTK